MKHALAKQAEVGAIEVADAAGDYVTDVDGNRYLDFAMGWCVGNLGWKHPEIEAAMQQDLDTIAWMDDATRKKALEKLHKVKNKIGYPDKWRNYDELVITREAYAKNALAAEAFETKRQLAKIGKPLDRAEIDKLVFNIAMGRSWAGIHYRSDTTAGARVGEDVAISILQDLVRTCTEDFEGFSFTRVDGTPVKINRNGEVS